MTYPTGLPPTHHAQARNLAQQTTRGQQGRYLTTQPVQQVPHRTTVAIVTGTFAQVFHGDDPSVARPDADMVQWIGAATPANGLDYDLWYTATI